MKLIEYKPRKTLTIDISNIPSEVDIDKCLKLFKHQKISIIDPNDKEIDSSESWVHPDYRIQESEYIVGHDPCYAEDESPSEVKIYKKSDSFNGNSIDNLWMPFPDPEGLNPFIDHKVWEAAKPKLNPEFGKILVYGTSGERSEYNDIATAFGYAEIYKRTNLFPEDYFEIHWLSESYIQEAEWIDRKRKCPSLTVKDLRWVDNMVDEIYEKHTKDLPISLDEERKNFWGHKYTAAILFDKFIKPIF